MLTMSDLFNATPAKTDYSAKDIEVLEGLEPVRKRPGMYIGGIDERAYHHLVAEIIDNAMDEAVAGYATNIEVHLGADGYVTVKDNGRGIPVDPHPKYPDKSALEVITTTLHSGGKFGGGAYAVSGGLHGVGLSAVNALSTHMVIEVAKDKKLYRQEYRQGKPVAPVCCLGPSAIVAEPAFPLCRIPKSLAKPFNSNRQHYSVWREQKLFCSEGWKSDGPVMPN